MIEVERKRKLADVAGLKRRLTAAGYRGTDTTVELDTYYSRPDVDFLATVECLRVRRRDDFAEITYKPASSTDTHSTADVIAKSETNVVLAGASQAVMADTLLEVLGMVRLCRVEKARTTFRHVNLDGVTVVIDLVTGVGAFVEVEVLAAEPGAATALLEQVERRLGLTGSPAESRPYRDLVLEHERPSTAAPNCPTPTEGP